MKTLAGLKSWFIRLFIFIIINNSLKADDVKYSIAAIKDTLNKKLIPISANQLTIINSNLIHEKLPNNKYTIKFKGERVLTFKDNEDIANFEIVVLWYIDENYKVVRNSIRLDFSSGLLSRYDSDLKEWVGVRIKIIDKM
jgi:hypothetical protein